MKNRGRINLFDEKLRFLRGVILSLIAMLIVLGAGQSGYADLPSFDDVLGGLEDLSAPTSLPDGVMYVHAVDVGQGDCTLVRYNEYSILIDAGENGMGDEVLDYLSSQGVTSLTWVIGSHPHSDHIGGLDTVIDGIDVENVMLTRHADENIPATKTYNDLLTAIMNKSLTVTTAVTGESFRMGDLTMTVLSSGEQYADYNESSIVLKFDFGETDFITGGDITESTERDLIAAGYDLSAAVYKTSHHGSAQSNCEEFLDAVSPAVALIGCGADNDYGHPADAVLDRFAERGIAYYRTDILGNIVISCDGQTVTVQ